MYQPRLSGVFLQICRNWWYDCTMNPKERLTKHLRDHGYSVTPPRLSVFDVLQHQEPFSMNDIVARCPDVDRASVYRTIDLFEQLGIVQRLQTGWKHKFELSDEFHAHHHHFTCLNCGRTFVLPEDPVVEKHLQRLADEAGFRLERHQLELSGTCPDCLKRA